MRRRAFSFSSWASRSMNPQKCLVATKKQKHLTPEKRKICNARPPALQIIRSYDRQGAAQALGSDDGDAAGGDSPRTGSQPQSAFFEDLSARMFCQTIR